MPRPDNAVIVSLRSYRARMSALDTATMEDMGRRWLNIEAALDSNIAALAEEMTRRMEAGETITRGMVYKAERYQILKAQMNDEIRKYNKDFAVGAISDAQERAATLGINAAQDAISLSYPDPLSVSFNRINIGAVENMIGYAGDGSPLNALLKNDYPDAYNGLLDALVSGVAKGKGARVVAREMADGMGMGLDRSLLIARTEINRSYRQASTEQYRESGVVSGFMRLAARDEACLACILLDGERLDSEDELDDHPNGRCTAVPIIDGMDPPEWQIGSDWLQAQDEEKQRAIMGNSRFELWKGGTDLSAFATKTENRTWGSAPALTPISALEESE